jgi:hypothetical protein
MDRKDKDNGVGGGHGAGLSPWRPGFDSRRLHPKKEAAVQMSRSAELLEKAEGSLVRMAESLAAGKPEELVRYLEVMSRFHKYSFHNVMLILSQNPEASRVAGFRKWKEQFGRFVKKGEHGIAILFPRIKVEDLEDGTPERRLAGFSVGYVFDVKQTDGEELPQAPAWRAEGHASQADVDRLAGEIRKAGISLTIADEAVSIPGADGVTFDGGKQIAVRSSLSSLETVRCLAHEWAHAILHFGEDRVESREQRELEADSVAYAVASALGYDVHSTSYNYLAGWNATPETLKASLGRILTATRRILVAVSGELEEEAA